MVANANESDPRPDITRLAIEEEEEGINVKERWHDDIAVGRSREETGRVSRISSKGVFSREEDWQALRFLHPSVVQQVHTYLVSIGQQQIMLVFATSKHKLHLLTIY